MGYPTMEYEAIAGTAGRVVVEPLEPGFGHTLGSAISEALLRTLEGAAVIGVKIDGASGMRDALKGSSMDVADVVALCAGVAVALPEGAEEAILTVKASGAGAVTAGDLQCPDGVSIGNPEHVIAVLDAASAKLSLQLLVRPGCGAEDAAVAPAGWLATTARYTPVMRVDYEVGSARVGQRTDFDRLTIDIQTDGTMAPDQAVYRASEVLTAQFDVLLTDEWRGIGRLLPSLGEDVVAPAPKRAEDEIYIEDLGLGARSYNGLRRAGVSTLSDLLALSLAEIKAIPNFGKKSVDEVLTALGERDLELAPG